MEQAVENWRDLNFSSSKLDVENDSHANFIAIRLSVVLAKFYKS